MPWPAFVLLAVVMSLFYGVYAVTIWFLSPDLADPKQRISNHGAWFQAWKYIFRHPHYFHQFWFNLAGSALGWAALGYGLHRMLEEMKPFGWTEAGLFTVGAIGVYGYLPNMLHRIVGGIESATDAVKRMTETLALKK